MSKRLRVAVIGCGIGKRHVEAFQTMPDRFDLVAVCDTNEPRAHAVAAAASIPRVTTDFQAVCAMSDVDVIDICTPPSLHFQQAMQVLAAGKHCICEKPLVGSLREVDELRAAAAQAGKHMMPVFQYRYGNGLQKLKLLVNKGVAGRAYVTTIEMCWRRRADYYATPWRGKWATDLGGMVNGLAVHALDMFMYVLGPISSVFAHTATLVNPIEVEDCAAVTMQMADGSLATLACTLGSTVQITRLRFCFSNMVAESNTRCYNPGGDPWVYSGDTPEWQYKIDASLAEYTPQAEGFAREFALFYEALQSGGALPVSLADSYRAIELVTAIYKSVQTERPVNLPLVKDNWYNGWRP